MRARGLCDCFRVLDWGRVVDPGGGTRCVARNIVYRGGLLPCIFMFVEPIFLLIDGVGVAAFSVVMKGCDDVPVPAFSRRADGDSLLLVRYKTAQFIDRGHHGGGASRARMPLNLLIYLSHIYLSDDLLCVQRGWFVMNKSLTGIKPNPEESLENRQGRFIFGIPLIIKC